MTKRPLRTVAILCSARKTHYRDMPGVEVYDEVRDARTFAGGMPVVAHPPCRAWSAFCRHQAKPEPGEMELGPWCVEQVRTWGGVLEHPALSRLWEHCNLPLPGERTVDEWTMRVKQSWFGDSRTKNTWLFIVGVEPSELPDIPLRLHSPQGDRRRWQLMSHQQRARTSREFNGWLVEVARRAIV